MLTPEQKQANKIQYTSLLSRIKLDVAPIMQLLESVDYFDKPVTPQQFRSYSGGLCEYAIDLCFELGNLCAAYCPNTYSEETIFKVALLRDIYRATLYEPQVRSVKNSQTNSWEDVLVWQTSESRISYGNVGFSSYMQLRNLVPFSDEELEAICNSQLNSGYSIDEAKIKRCFPLVALLSMADLAVSYLPNAGLNKIIQ